MSPVLVIEMDGNAYSLMSQVIPEATAAADQRFNHAVAVIGYQDQDTHQSLLIKNSWGFFWGKYGTAYLPATHRGIKEMVIPTWKKVQLNIREQYPMWTVTLYDEDEPPDRVNIREALKLGGNSTGIEIREKMEFS